MRKAQRETLPYTFARVSVMKSRLIGKDEYYKLLKMDLSSMTRYLQESEYKDEITKLSAAYSGVDLVDRALTEHDVKIFTKLRKISPRSVGEIINVYLGRWDFHNLKVVLRGLFSNAKKTEVMELIVPIGDFGKTHFAMLFDTGSIQEAISKSRIVSEKDVKEALEKFLLSNRLIELENRLDHISFENSTTKCELCPGYGEIYRRFLLRDIDILNIKNLLRFKREKLNPATIMEYMVLGGDKLGQKSLAKLANSENLPALLQMLSKTYYGKFIDFAENSDLIALELDLQSYNLRNAIIRSRKNPLSIASVLTYMMKKVVETKNLRSIVKSKHLGLDMDFVEKKLLVV